MSVLRVVCCVALLDLACSHGAPPPAEPTQEAPKAPADGASRPVVSRQNSQAPGEAQPAPEQQEHRAAGKHEHHHPKGFHMDFSEVERFAKHFDDPKRDVWQKPNDVIALMQLQAGQTVADVGAGTGYFLGYLSQAVGPKGRVLGLDVEPAMVKYMTQRVQAQRWTNVEVATVPYDDPQLPAGTIDRVLIVNTWHHIDDRPLYTQNIARSLTATGAVFVVDFTLESDVGPPANHRLSPEQVVQELQLGGLDARVLAEALPKQYVVQGTLR